MALRIYGSLPFILEWNIADWNSETIENNYSLKPHESKWYFKK